MGCCGIIAVLVVLLAMLFAGWSIEVAILVLACVVAICMNEGSDN